MIIPHEQLSAAALRGLIESFVSREGTDYGESEVPFDTKVQQVRRRLDEGTAVILFDPQDDSFTIVFKEDAPRDAQD